MRFKFKTVIGKKFVSKNDEVAPSSFIHPRVHHFFLMVHFFIWHTDNRCQLAPPLPDMKFIKIY